MPLPLPPPHMLSDAARITVPRAATLVRFSLANVADPSTDHVSPPSVVRSTPMRAPPVAPRLLSRALPATSVWKVGSIGSNSSEPIEGDDSESVSGIHDGLTAVAFVVLHTPPFTAPRNKMSAFVGCNAIAWIQPAISLLGGMVTCPPSVEAGPITIHGSPTCMAGAGASAGAVVPF